MDERSLNALHDTESMSVDVLVDGGSGDSLFVINLCAANVPQAIDASSVQEWGIAGIHRYKLYQVSRMEDGRRRYRVRLGFFSSEAAAELVLQTVRGKFASAFSSCLADEDLKHASGYLKRPLHEIQEIQDLQRTGRYRLPKIDTDKSQKVRSPFVAERTASSSDTQRVPALKPRASTEVTADHTSLTKVAAITDKLMENSVVEFEWSPPSKAKPVAPTKAAPTPIQKSSPAVKKSVPTSKPRSPAPLHIEEIPLTPPPTKTSTSGQYHVASGRDIPDFGLSLSDVHATHEKSAARPPTKKPANELPKPLVSAEALAKLRAAAQPRNQPAVIPTLDSTQTIRTLTKNEVEDANAARWYVVQLAVSDQPANLDTMPRLDIFEAYRLYSVATMDGAVIRHALRLGFFREEVSAEAVLGYLKTFFGDPHIERVSDAEQKRFIDPPPKKSTGDADTAKPQARVIALEEAREPKFEHASTIVIPAPAATRSPEIGAHSTGATGSHSVGKSATPATKRSASTTARKTSGTKVNGKPLTSKYAHLSVEERTAIKEARMLGLSETAIRRIEPNSLLSRLVGKLTK